MEEVDKIIIHSLKKLGCDVDENITSMGGFDTELVVRAAAVCLEVIKPGLGLPTSLPINMAARFRQAATLAQTCQELGYKGDIGYQTFLYSSETDLRRVFMFLIEKLPKECEETVTEPLSKSAQLEKLIAISVSEHLSVPWLPHYCHKKRTKISDRVSTPFDTVRLDSEQYRVPPQKFLIPSVISAINEELHPSGLSLQEKIKWLNSQKYTEELKIQESVSGLLGRVSNLKLREAGEKSEETPKVEIEAEEKKEESKSDVLKSECENLQSLIQSMQSEIETISSELRATQVLEQTELAKLEIIEQQKSVKVRAYELLENGEENVKKLKESIQTNVNKLINLASQWEKHRVPLINKYRDERAKHSSKMSIHQKLLNDLRQLKQKDRELLEESRSKDQQYVQLMEEVEKLPREVNRAAYTQRILEIINNVRKQSNEIDKVLADTREIQKEINTLTGRVDRSFTIVDELIFRDARASEASRRAYKLLASLHSDCRELVSLIQETGATIREIRDLEEQIDSESAKNVGANLGRITADLKQMQQETATLTAQLQNKQGS